MNSKFRCWTPSPFSGENWQKLMRNRHLLVKYDITSDKTMQLWPGNNTGRDFVSSAKYKIFFLRYLYCGHNSAAKMFTIPAKNNKDSDTAPF